MRRLMLAAALGVVSCSPAYADVWTFLKNSTLEEHKTDQAYRVPALGLDLRVYEWSPKSNPETTCVAAFGQTHPVGLQCFPKSTNDN